MILKSEGHRSLAPSIHWLGTSGSDDLLQVNSYVLHRNGRAVLIDPGPVPAFGEIRSAFAAVTGRPFPDAIVVSHQDPDVCASLPLWEEAGFRGRIYAHWKTAMLLPSLGIKLKVTDSGRDRTSMIMGDLSLELLNAPFLHSPGALCLYDGETGTLFSGDLFGAFGTDNRLFSDMGQLEPMISFHNLYMPSSGEIKNFIEGLGDREIRMICPQHGAIHSGNIPEVISALGNISSEKSVSSELYELRMSRFELQKSIVLSNDEKILDSVTGLYNQIYFNSYFPVFSESHKGGYCAYIRLDGMKAFNETYGYSEGDSAISLLAQIILAGKSEQCMVFRASGPVIIALVPSGGEADIKAFIRKIQDLVGKSEEFLIKMTCSAAIIPLAELVGNSSDGLTILKDAVHRRFKILDRMGVNSLCASIEDGPIYSDRKIILILDQDRNNGLFLKDYFRRRGFETILCTDGSRALREIDINRPSIILSEVHISPVDAFQLRAHLLNSEDLANIPFILLSHLKTDSLIRRAFHLKISHYLKKPVSLVELEELVNSLAETEL